MRRKRLGIVSLVGLGRSRRARRRALGERRQRGLREGDQGLQDLLPARSSSASTSSRENGKGAKEAAAKLGDTVTYNGPTEASAAKQVPFIDTAVRQGYNAIIISANDPNAVAPALKRAQQRGLKVISYDGDVAQGRPHDLRQPADGVRDRRVPGRVDRRPDRLQGRDRDPLGDADGREPEHLDQVHEGDAEEAEVQEHEARQGRLRQRQPDTNSAKETQALLQAYPNLKGIISPTTVGHLVGGAACSTRRASARRSR